MDKNETYSEMARNMRFYGDMRFKQLTLLMAWLTLAAAGVAQFGSRILVDGLSVKAVVAVAGMLFTAVFWIMEVRSSLYWAANRNHAASVWPRLPGIFMQWMNATNAVLVLYFCIFSFWLWCLSEWTRHTILELAIVFAFGGLLFILVLFTSVNYMALWRHEEKDPDHVSRSADARESPG